MATAVGPRERAIFSNSLAVLPLGLCGQSAVVELKMEIQVYGKIIAVDCFTNITMENAVMTKLCGTKHCFDIFFIPMKSIRAVQFPDYVSIPKMLHEQVSIITGAKMREERRKLKLQQQKFRQRKLERQAKKLAQAEAETL